MASKEPKHRDWVKLWIKEALLGTIREDLTPEERGTWYDFLLLAGNCRVPGIISANENTALPVKRIAGILNTPEALIQQCIVKFEKSGRIRVRPNGVIYITNWEKYQYSDYDRVKKYRQSHQNTQPDDFTTFLDELRPKYPGIDVDAELEKCKLWWSGNNKTMKNPKLAFRNWLDKAKPSTTDNIPTQEDEDYANKDWKSKT